MRKLFAALLIVALLSGLAALAEENACVIRLTDITLSYVGESGANSATFQDATLTVAMGMPEDRATLQLMFDSGEGQAVDAVMQIVDDRVLFSMGGLSATYAVGLDRFATGDMTGAGLAAAVSNAFSLAGLHLDVVLYAFTHEDADGMRALDTALPMPQLVQVVQAMLSLGNGVEPAEEADLAELQARVEGLEGEARLSFRYSPEAGVFELATFQDGMGMRLSGHFAMAVEPMTFFAVAGEDTEICDLMSLTDAQWEALQGELGILFPKFVDYADGLGLDDVVP